MWCNTLGFSLFGTQSHGKPDRKTLDTAKTHQADRLSEAGRHAIVRQASSVFMSNTNHEEDQPVHLKVRNEPSEVSEHDVYADRAPLLPGGRL